MADAGLSDGQVAGAIATGTGFLIAMGKGLRWFMQWRRSRLTDLEARVDAMADDVMAAKDHAATAMRQVGCVANACTVLVDEVTTMNPNSLALSQARAMIGSEFPELLSRVFRLSPGIPIDMQERLKEIDRATRSDNGRG